MIRKDALVENEIYHVFNRGVEKKQIFTDKRDYQHAIELLYYYHFDRIRIRYSELSRCKPEILDEELKALVKSKLIKVEIIAYCLMPNHFHLIIKQVAPKGISNFLADFQNSYTKYFNVKRDRVGPLFQGPFKSVHVKNDEYLLHLSRYIHLNPVSSFLIKQNQLTNYPWSSFSKFCENKTGLCEKDIILNNYATNESYQDFVLDYAEYSQSLEMIQHLTFNEY